MADREFQVPSDEERARDRELLAALEDHEPIGERYARTGEIPVAEKRDPAMDPSPGATMERDSTPVKPIPKPPRPVLRMVVRGLIAVASVVALYYLVTLWQVWTTGRSDQARQVDAIVVLGAAQYDGRPSPQFAARLDHVAELWPQGLADTVVVTGGNQPGDRFTEAETAFEYLVARDVPAEKILVEDTSASTYESLEFVHERFGDEVQSVLIVTDPYHALRSRMVAAEVGFEAFVSPVEDSVVTGGNELQREFEEAAGVALGRLIGFERLSGLTD